MPQRQLRSVSAGLLSSAKFWAHSLPILVLCSLRDLKATATCFQIFGQLRVRTVSEHSRSPVPISHWQKNNNDCIVSSVMWLATSAGIATKCSPLASVVSCMMFATVGKTWFEQLCWWRVNSCHQGWLLPEWICCDSCDCSPNAADSPLVTAPCDCSQALPGAELWTWSTRGTESDWSHSTAVVSFIFSTNGRWNTHFCSSTIKTPLFVKHQGEKFVPFLWVKAQSRHHWINDIHLDLEFVQRVHSSWHVSCGTLHATEIIKIRNQCHLGVVSRALPTPFVVVWEWWWCKVLHDLQSKFPQRLPCFFHLTKQQQQQQQQQQGLCSQELHASLFHGFNACVIVDWKAEPEEDKDKQHEHQLPLCKSRNQKVIQNKELQDRRQWTLHSPQVERSDCFCEQRSQVNIAQGVGSFDGQLHLGGSKWCWCHVQQATEKDTWKLFSTSLLTRRGMPISSLSLIQVSPTTLTWQTFARTSKNRFPRKLRNGSLGSNCWDDFPHQFQRDTAILQCSLDCSQQSSNFLA